MSGTLASQGSASQVAPGPAAGSARPRKFGCGCLGPVTFALLLGVGVLVLEDKGSMAMSFAVDGSAKGYLKGTNAPSEDTTGRLHYATESEFALVCGEKGKSSF